MLNSRSRRIISILVASLVCTPSCSRVRSVLGEDTTAHRPVCAVVAPEGLPPDELAAAVGTIVTSVRDDHGSLSMFVADTASAAAFPMIRLDAEANGGSFRSSAKNDANRHDDAAAWAKAARQQIDAQLASVVAGDGVDLVGGIELCARLLRDEGEGASIALVASGVHRTVDLDVANEPARADELRSLVADAVDGRLRLDLYGIGRIDRTATDGPVARDVIGPVVRAWTDACADLGTRCRIHGPSTDRSTKEA